MKHNQTKIQEFINAQPECDVVTAYAEWYAGELLKRVVELEDAAKHITDWYGENTPGTYKPPGMAELQALLQEQG